MSNSGRVRYVNVVPAPKIEPKIKIEISSDDETELIPCPVCSKEFASAIALRNHGRIQHTDTFYDSPHLFEIEAAQKDPTTISVQRAKAQAMTPVKETQTPKKKPIVVSTYSKMDEIIKQREKALLASMKPGNLQSLASTDVEYIIVKNSNVDGTTMKMTLTPAKQLPIPVKKTLAEKKEIAKPRKRKIEKVEAPKEQASRSKEGKVLDPITGPFECLQPSTLVADGVCHQIFFSCCEYSIHFRDEHTRRRKGNRCQVCEKLLMDSESDMPYNCLVCGAGFETHKELNEHTSVEHVKLKPFECTICHKRFTQQGGVQQHMRMHTGVRPFSCTYCPKAFTQKSGLDQHLRIHTGVKPYRCVICSKTFCQSVHLKQHVRTHTNVAPFECGICNKRFKQSSHLNYHLKNHNVQNMTPEQREKFNGMVREISRGNAAATQPRVVQGREVMRRQPKNVVVLRQDNGTLVEINQDDLYEYVVTEEEVPVEQDMGETIEITEVDQEQIQSEEDHQEQLLAEQSIAVEQVEEGTETYILGDSWGEEEDSQDGEEGEEQEGQEQEGQEQEGEVGEEGEEQEEGEFLEEEGEEQDE